jgi:hypothetical protein
MATLGCFMNWFGLAVSAVLISACASPPTPGPGVRVYNLTQGLARVDASGEWTIYAEGKEFLHQANGDCMADGKSTPCMWIGVAFEFAAEAETTVLTCKGTFSEPTDIVTAREVVARKAREHASTVELRGRTGKVFWQGYNIADGSTNPNTTLVICEHNGKEVLRYAFTIAEQPNTTVEGDARKNGARP